MIKITKQYNIGASWGAMKITWTHLAVYVNAFSALLVAMTFHHTTLVDWVDIPLPIFLLAIGIVIVIAGIFEYKLSLPSVFQFHMDQQLKHSVIFSSFIKETKDNQKEIIKELKKLKREGESNVLS